MELSQDLGHRPIVFIRFKSFNPYDYDDRGKRTTSCWSITKDGICTVKKSKQSEWSDRLNKLGESIQYWINPENTANKKSKQFNCITGVGNSPLFLDESPFRQIRRYLEPHFVVQTFDEFAEMEIRPKIGVSCRSLLYYDM
jgi:hypothetical protein